MAYVKERFRQGLVEGDIVADFWCDRRRYAFVQEKGAALGVYRLFRSTGGVVDWAPAEFPEDAWRLKYEQ